MTHAWIDASAGVAGDMVLGALVDLGADLDAVQRAVDAVAPEGVRLGASIVTRCGQRGTKASVTVLAEHSPHRPWSQLRSMIESADLDAVTRDRAVAVFRMLAEAEGRAHGIDPEDVHFHEVGAWDSIADVVGSCEALRLLGVDSVSASPIALGAGRIRAAHGDIPVPVPAVAELMVGWRSVSSTTMSGLTTGDFGEYHAHHHANGDDPHEHTHDADHDHAHAGDHHHDGPAEQAGHRREHGHHHGDDQPATVTTPGEVGELATPTGVALIRAWASACEPMPAMTVKGIGIGAGGKDFADHPNVVRIVLGELEDWGLSSGSALPAGVAETTGPRMCTTSGVPTEPTDVLELACNVDDMDPRLWPGVLDDCLAAGALDAWLTPILMKKGRPAHTLSTLVAPENRGAVEAVMLTRTTTLGVRCSPRTRTTLDRTFVTLDVLGFPLTVKVGSRGGVVLHAAAEFASIEEIAAQTGRSASEIAQRAASAIVEAGLTPGATLA